MGYVGVGFAWVREWMGCVGQIFTLVAWVAKVKIFFTWVIIFTSLGWVKYIFAWVKIFCMGLCDGQNFLRGSKILACINFFYFFFFYVGRHLFARRDYFIVLQLKVRQFFRESPPRKSRTKADLGPPATF